MEFSKPLKLNHIFRRLYRNGNQAANRYLVLYCRPNHLKENRVGITVGKKLGKAVTRNRVRRRNPPPVDRAPPARGGWGGGGR